MPKNIMAGDGGKVQVEDDKIWKLLRELKQRPYTVSGEVKCDRYRSLGDDFGNQKFVSGIILHKQHIDGMHTMPLV